MAKDKSSLTKEESLFLQAAMIQAQQEGDEEAVQKLADLAQNPEELREILERVKKSEEGGEEPLT